MKINKKQLVTIILKEFRDTFKLKPKQIDSKELEKLLDLEGVKIDDVNIDIEAAQEYLKNKLEEK